MSNIYASGHGTRKKQLAPLLRASKCGYKYFTTEYDSLQDCLESCLDIVLTVFKSFFKKVFKSLWEMRYIETRLKKISCYFLKLPVFIVIALEPYILATAAKYFYAIFVAKIVL